MGSGYKMASGSWEEFFAVHLPPTDFEDNRSLLKEFCERHDQYGNKIVLVTVSIFFTSGYHERAQTKGFGNQNKDSSQSPTVVVVFFSVSHSVVLCFRQRF